MAKLRSRSEPVSFQEIGGAVMIVLGPLHAAPETRTISKCAIHLRH
jgi:hypothetical protein